MKNKVVVTIAGRDYTMVAVEDEAYVRKCAAHVDGQLRETLNTRLSQADSAVLAAMNIADEMLKQQSGTENLRGQLKGYLDEASRAKSELSECKREIFKLQQQLAKAQK